MPLIGLTAWVTKNSLPAPEQQGITGLGLILVAWFGVVAFCLLLLLAASRAQDLLQALGAMALPLVVVLVAAYLLFSTIRDVNSASA